MVGTLRFAHPTVLIQISKSLTVIASQRVARTLALHSLVVPAKRSASRDPYAAASRFGTVANAFCSNARRWLWVPAFAGTTQEDSIVKQQTQLHAPRRDAPESCMYLSPPLRAWGMPGARCTRSLVCVV
jgi:hypothetical protein